MDNSDHRSRHDPQPFLDAPRRTADRAPASPAHSARALSTDSDGDASAYTLMAAGRRTGKTAFLRLLLDTSAVSPTATQDQLAGVAKFVQGCAGFTSHIRTVSVNVDLAVGVPASDKTELKTLTLSLVDTPSLDFDDPAASQRTVDEIMRHVDTRFSESVQDAHKAYAGDHHVHLCVYFLDPDTIVPPAAVPLAPAPRARNGSLSKPDAVILEPPVPTNPLLCRPTLPEADIATIRRLSVRVNVLPVVGRADLLTNDRLAAVKIAVRRDLAAAGIGFGIFDHTPAHPVGGPDLGLIVLMADGAHANGASPTPTPLPYALIAPDLFSHSDGVARPAPSRHELVRQYTPTPAQRAQIAPGRWTRTFRWGSLDCLDAAHCDFLQLRGAIFHHMKTLQKYTREFLLERFRADIMAQTQTQSAPPARTQANVPARTQLTAQLNTRLPQGQSQGVRPVLAIDTAPERDRRASLSVSVSRSGEPPSVAVSLSAQTLLPELSPKTASSTRSQRTRTKKITVACNFCRSRKLKCDGGRPACSQCFKRSNACDYMAGHKRRGTGKRRRPGAGTGVDDGSESDEGGDGEGESADPSQSPDVASSLAHSHSHPHSRRNSNAHGSDGDVHVSVKANGSVQLPPLNGTIAAALDRRDESTTLAPILLPAAAAGHAAVERAYVKHELPPIATLPPVSPEPLQGTNLGAGSSGGGGGQGQGQRRRTSSAASVKGQGTRQGGYSSKIVACNFCRARKTRCDGVHPSCGSCARRSLPCNYVNDREGGNPKGRPKVAAAAAAASSVSVSVSASNSLSAAGPSLTPPMGHAYDGYGRHGAHGNGSVNGRANGHGHGHANGSANGHVNGHGHGGNGHGHGGNGHGHGAEQDVSLKRSLDADASQAQTNKKMRVAEEFGANVVAVSQLT